MPETSSIRSAVSIQYRFVTDGQTDGRTQAIDNSALAYSVARVQTMNADAVQSRSAAFHVTQ